MYHMFAALNPVLHSKIRLAIVSLLVKEDSQEFNQILIKTNASAGNLSVQLQKLQKLGYIEITKQFRDNYPLTICKITLKGTEAYFEYAEALKSYI